MGKVFEDGIDERMAAWIAASACSSWRRRRGDGGHVNVSPKGPIETAAGPRAATASPTSTGSAAAPRRPPTCATTGASRSCSARSRARRGSCACTAAAGSSPPATRPSQRWPRPAWTRSTCREVNRAIVDVAVERVSDSCGYGVPLMAYEGQREQTERWAQTKLRKEAPTRCAATSRSATRRASTGCRPSTSPAGDALREVAGARQRLRHRRGRRARGAADARGVRRAVRPPRGRRRRRRARAAPSPTSRGYVARVRIFNPDGSEAELSGNGVRQAILYLRAPGLDRRRPLLRPDDRGRDPPDDPVADDLPRRHGPRPLTSPTSRGRPDGAGELTAGGRAWRFQHVSIGNPQCAIALADPARGRGARPRRARARDRAQPRSSRAARTSASSRPPATAPSARGSSSAAGGDAVLGHRGLRRGGRARPARRRLAGDRPARRRRARGRRRGGPARRPHGLGGPRVPPARSTGG